jgi:hypothetical protein
MHVSGRAAALVESANLTGHELLTRSQLFLYPSYLPGTESLLG